MKKWFQSFFLLLLVILLVLSLAGCSSSLKKEPSSGKEGQGGNQVQQAGGSFPSRPIQLVVGYSAGAATDFQARIIAKYAQEVFGQPLTIINMPGAGGSVSWNFVAKQKPDGYTLGVYNLPVFLIKPFVEDTDYTLESYEPIINWGYDATVFVVKPDSPYKSLQDLVKAAKAKPGSITVGTAGTYVGQHMAILLLEQAAGIDFKELPFPGAADAQTALLGGTIDVNSTNLADAYRLGNQVRVLAVATKERHKRMPDVPTFTEAGYPVVMSTDRGIMAPKGTPPEVLQTLNEGFKKIFAKEQFQQEMEKAGADLMVIPREELKPEMEKRSRQYHELLNKLEQTKK